MKEYLKKLKTQINKILQMIMRKQKFIKLEKKFKIKRKRKQFNNKIQKQNKQYKLFRNKKKKNKI